MSTATALSRVTGFVRMWATAFALGATGLMSAYAVANNIPNMLFELVAGGIVSSLFIPTLLEARATRGEEEAGRFASHVFNLSVIALGVIALLGTVFPEPFIWTQTFRLSGAEAEATRRLGSYFFRFFAVQVVIYAGGTIIQSRLNAERRYLWPALGPVFNNLVVIATMFAFVALRHDVRAATAVLAIGTTLGVLVMFAVQIPTLLKLGVHYEFGLGFHDPELRRMLVLAVPTVLYVVTNLVAVSFRNASAFAVAPNGPSVLMYAWTFYQLPYGILAVALATAVFTEMSHASGTQDWEGFKKHLAAGLRATGILMLPTSAVLVVLATPFVTLYRVGAFKQADVPTVAGALRWWAAGLVFYASTMFVLRAFYSLKDTRTPMFVNLGLSAVQVGLYLLLTTQIGAWTGLGINGIPIADGIFFALSLGALLALLRRKVGSFDLRSVVSTYGRMLIASAVGAAIAWAIANALASLTTGVAGALIQIAAAGLPGLAAAWVTARLLGVREVDIVVTAVKRVWSRVRPGSA